MLETAYLVAKILMSVIFVLTSIVLLVLCASAHKIKREFEILEAQIKYDLHKAYNIGATVLSIILTIAFTKPGAKTPFWVSALSFTGLSKFKKLYYPLADMWGSVKELSFKIKELVR